MRLHFIHPTRNYIQWNLFYYIGKRKFQIQRKCQKISFFDIFSEIHSASPETKSSLNPQIRDLWDSILEKERLGHPFIYTILNSETFDSENQNLLTTASGQSKGTVLQEQVLRRRMNSKIIASKGFTL